MANPLDQFKIKEILHIEYYGYNLSITNSSLFMFLSAASIICYLYVATSKRETIPGRLQITSELLYQFILDMIKQNIGDEGKKFIPIIFSLFTFILACNLFGMVPYSFTVTSHLSVTLLLAMLIFCMVIIIGLSLHGLRFFALFLPKGTPWWLAPLMVVIELFTFLARPISLSLRLAANMVAGHVLLKVVASFAVSVIFYLKIFVIPFIIILIGFEIFVALLQAYIFSILSCVYLNDVINIH